MRVIAGREGGRRLRVPRGRRVRPALARLKASLFDILSSRGLVDGAGILDLFAGTGSLGIEALSRGAASVVFVEQDRVTVRALRDNVSTIGRDAQARVVVDSVPKALARLARHAERFDGVFVDPPYDTPWMERTLRGLDRAGLVRGGGWVAVHHRRGQVLRDRYGRLEVELRRPIGSAEIALYRWRDDAGVGGAEGGAREGDPGSRPETLG